MPKTGTLSPSNHLFWYLCIFVSSYFTYVSFYLFRLGSIPIPNSFPIPIPFPLRSVPLANQFDLHLLVWLCLTFHGLNLYRLKTDLIKTSAYRPNKIRNWVIKQSLETNHNMVFTVCVCVCEHLPQQELTFYSYPATPYIHVQIESKGVVSATQYHRALGLH